jgi:alkaline phosphatase
MTPYEDPFIIHCNFPVTISTSLIYLYTCICLSGRATGLVTNARITHATPAPTYASCPHRDWEADADLPTDARGKCQDIALQLIEKGRNISV